MIKLTEVTELLGQKEPEYTPIYVPVDVVVRVWNSKTIVDYDGQSHTVVESPEEVARKVLEYQLEMNRHRLGLVKKDELFRLAGLEEQKDE